MKILYLYTEIMGYNLPIFDKLVSQHNASVYVIHWNKNKLTPFKPEAIDGVTFHERSSFRSTAEIIEFTDQFLPDAVYISGWQDKGYLPVAQHLKKKNIPIVMGLDSQWTGSFRQQIGSRLIRWIYKNRYFSYAWVPGPMQYEYASRIGFSSQEIICNLLSANSELFIQATTTITSRKSTSYPKKFIFVGRFSEQKGIDILIRAFIIYKNKYHGDWSLDCFGNGPLGDLLSKYPEINIHPFSDQNQLVEEAKTAGAFILPSRYEPWGVAVHEFATAGLPLILSDQVGARHQFLINGLNGYTFVNNSAEDLASKMNLISQASDHDLINMSLSSLKLAQSITPEITTASLISIIQ